MGKYESHEANYQLATFCQQMIAKPALNYGMDK